MRDGTGFRRWRSLATTGTDRHSPRWLALVALALVELLLMVALGGEARADLYRLLPVTSSTSGFVYRYDPTTAAFERESTLTAQLFVDRAETIGGGRMSVSTSVLYPLPNEESHLTLPSVQATYGVTESGEIGLVVPLLVYSNSNVGLTSSYFDPVIVRGKYRFYTGSSLQAAGGLSVETLTVNAAARDIVVRPDLYLSGPRWPVTDTIRVEPYLSVGFQIFPDTLDHSDARWGVGVDAAWRERFAMGIAVIGRNPIDQSSSLEENAELRNNYDVAVTGRVDLWEGRVTAFAGVLIPWDSAERAEYDYVPVAGFETSF